MSKHVEYLNDEVLYEIYLFDGAKEYSEEGVYYFDKYYKTLELANCAAEAALYITDEYNHALVFENTYTWDNNENDMICSDSKCVSELFSYSDEQTENTALEESKFVS